MPSKHIHLPHFHLAGKNRDVDMTQGSIARHIMAFALPLVLGNLFQQLYNTVDTWVVGNFVSNEAFSAVGTVGPIINMLIGIFIYGEVISGSELSAMTLVWIGIAIFALGGFFIKKNTEGSRAQRLS